MHGEGYTAGGLWEGADVGSLQQATDVAEMRSEVRSEARPEVRSEVRSLQLYRCTNGRGWEDGAAFSSHTLVVMPSEVLSSLEQKW